MAEDKKGRRGKKKVKKNIPNGIININATFNNTHVTICDTMGNTIAWATAGTSGFKGSRKGTPFAAQLAVEGAIKKAMDHGLKAASIKITGPGPGRESALRSISRTGIRVIFIKDVTPIPHNGCRPPKQRRV